MKVIVLGKEGYIAQNIICELKSRNIEFIQTSVDPEDNESIHLDLLKPDLFNYDVIKENDIILFLAAISSPELCEKNYEYAYNVNVRGTSYFVEAALLKNAKVLFFSSDVVYGFDETVIYNEKSICNPAGKYGEMKYEIESRFIDHENFAVFRLSYIFSKNDKFSSYLINCLKNHETAEIFHPFIRNIVYIVDLIDAVFKYIENYKNFIDYKTVNICGLESLSRVDVADYLVNTINNDFKYRIVEPDSSFFKMRPRIIKTQSAYLKDILGENPTKIAEAVVKEFKRL